MLVTEAAWEFLELISFSSEYLYTHALPPGNIFFLGFKMLAVTHKFDAHADHLGSPALLAICYSAFCMQEDLSLMHPLMENTRQPKLGVRRAVC